jgi:ABC-type uncharacterized transport system permease subunit
MSWIENISITCFLASYAVALALEVSRLFFRSGVRGALMVGFSAAGLLAHTLYLAHRAATNAASPLSSELDFYLVAAWVLAVVYLYLTFYHPQHRMGLFVLPAVLVFVISARLFADPRPFPKTTASYWWGAIHGICLLLGTVAVTVGFLTGVMYLLQARRLKKKLPPGQGLRLPSLEWLQRMNARTIALAALTLTGGFLAGIVLNLINARQGSGVPWTDPVILSSSFLMVWMIVAWLFNHLYKPAQQGRKVAYLTVASFIFLVIALVSILAPTRHGAKEVRSSEVGMRNDSTVADWRCSDSAIRNSQSAIGGLA